MGIRKRLQRRQAHHDKWVYLVGGLGRVERGMKVRLAISAPMYGRRRRVIGWILADRSDPIVNLEWEATR